MRVSGRHSGLARDPRVRGRGGGRRREGRRARPGRGARASRGHRRPSSSRCTGSFREELRGRGAGRCSFTLSLPDQDKGNELFEEQVSIHAGPAGRRAPAAGATRPASQPCATCTRTPPQDEAENHWRKKGTGHWDFHQLNLILQRAALESALALGEVPGRLPLP